MTKKISKKNLKNVAYLVVRNKTKQEVTNVIFPNGLEIGVDNVKFPGRTTIHNDTRIRGALTPDSLTVSNDLTVGDDIILSSDGAVIKFGADAEVTLTHVNDGGLLFSDDSGIGTTKLMFGDAATFIQQQADGELGVDADSVVDITAPTVDMNASTAVILDTPVTNFKDDGVILKFGDDSEVTLTHVADTGLLLSDASGVGTTKLMFGDAACFIQQQADGELGIDADSIVNITAPTVDVDASTAVTITGPAVTIDSDAAGKPVLTLKTTHTTTTSSGELQFLKDAADTEDGEVLGQITFYGEDEGNNNTQFAGIVASISESDQTDEAGKLELQVAESDGTSTAMTTGLLLEGEHATDGQIDATIGAGAASTTTIAGVLKVSGDVIQASDGGTTISMDTSDNVTIAGDLTVGGGDIIGPTDGDLLVKSDGNMTFRIDADNDETGQSFAFQNNASTEIANLSEGGNLQIDGDLTVTGGDITLGEASDVATTISAVANDGTRAGKALTVSAGSSSTNGNDINGGNLILKSGGGDGTGTSEVQIWTKTNGTDAATQKLTVDAAGNIKSIIDGAALTFGADGEVTLTHVHDTGILLSDDSGRSPNKLMFGDDACFIQQQADGELGIDADSVINITAPTVDIDASTDCNISALLTVGGRILTNDTTEATTTTDGSLQTDGGLSVAMSAVIGDDLDLLSNGAILNIGVAEKFTATHANADNTLTITADNRLAFGDAGDYIVGDGTDLTIVSSNHATIDAAGDIKLDSASGNIFLQDATTDILLFDLDTSATQLDIQHKVDNDAAAVAFKQANGIINALSLDGAGNGGFGHKKYVLAGRASSLDISGVATAMPYSGGIITLNQDGAHIVTLPTATSTAEAAQLLGWHCRFAINEAGTGSSNITIVRKDTVNDIIVGRVASCAADSNLAEGITVGSNVVTFVDNVAVAGDFVDIVCVLATASATKFFVSGLAST